jgi:hypothetical protein
MKKVVIALGVLLLGHTASASTATDWTPYLKPMLSGCGYVNPTKELPARYKASITSKNIKGDSGFEDDGLYTTYTLKNSIAFGQPLVKVEYLQGHEWYHLKLYFKDAKFKTLRSQFKLPKIDVDEAEYTKVVKNDKEGYDIRTEGYLNLMFDRKQKTITCEAGH